MKRAVKKLPIAPVEKARKAIKQAVAEYAALEGERKRLYLSNDYAASEKAAARAAILEREGTNGLMAHDNAVSELREREKAIREKAANAVAAARSEYMAAVAAMYTALPEHLTGENAAELQLIQLDLINTPSEMLAYMERNNENPALMQLAERYAAKKAAEHEGDFSGLPNGWAAIRENTTTRSTLENFVSFFDTNAAGAANDPAGYWADMVTDDNAFIGSIDHYGVKEEYAAAAGTNE